MLRNKGPTYIIRLFYFMMIIVVFCVFTIPPNKKIASYFLKWASLRDAIPKSWKRVLKEYASNKNIELSGTKQL